MTLFADFRDNLKIAQDYFGLEEQEGEFSALCAELDRHIEGLEAKYHSPIVSAGSPLSFDGTGSTSTARASMIFDDVDD